jgi:hypothetical protein
MRPIAGNPPAKIVIDEVSNLKSRQVVIIKQRNNTWETELEIAFDEWVFLFWLDYLWNCHNQCHLIVSLDRHSFSPEMTISGICYGSRVRKDIIFIIVRNISHCSFDIGQWSKIRFKQSEYCHWQRWRMCVRRYSSLMWGKCTKWVEYTEWRGVQYETSVIVGIRRELCPMQMGWQALMAQYSC